MFLTELVSVEAEPRQIAKSVWDYVYLPVQASATGTAPDRENAKAYRFVLEVFSAKQRQPVVVTAPG